MLIYLSSPYRGDTEANTKLAQDFLRYAIAQGHTAIAPHLLFTQVLDDDKPEERALAMELNRDLIAHADEVWVLCGRLSEGMAAEVVEASRQDKKIRFVSRSLLPPVV